MRAGAECADRDTGQETAQLTQVRAGDLEIVYLVFDIVFLNGASCRHEGLAQRHVRLREALRASASDREGVLVTGSAIAARVLVLTPDALEPPLPGHAASLKWCITGSSPQDIQVRSMSAHSCPWTGYVVNR